MKKLIIALIFIPSLALAGGAFQTDDNSRPIQGAAPNGLLSQILTIASTPINLVGKMWWSITSPTACKYRLTPTTAKGAYPQFTVYADTPTGWVVNSNTPFLNLSGCTNGQLSIQ